MVGNPTIKVLRQRIGIYTMAKWDDLIDDFLHCTSMAAPSKGGMLTLGGSFPSYLLWENLITSISVSFINTAVPVEV